MVGGAIRSSASTISFVRYELMAGELHMADHTNLRVSILTMLITLCLKDLMIFSRIRVEQRP